MPKLQRFKAKLLGEGPGGAWTRMMLPFDVEKEFGSRARVSVKGAINGFPFASSIFPNGDGTHHLMVNKTMLRGAGASPGDTVSVAMEPDTAPRAVEVPKDLAAALSKKKGARELFDGLSPSCRKEYVEWITGAKKPETRVARIEKAIPLILERRRLKE